MNRNNVLRNFLAKTTARQCSLHSLANKSMFHVFFPLVACLLSFFCIIVHVLYSINMSIFPVYCHTNSMISTPGNSARRYIRLLQKTVNFYHFCLVLCLLWNFKYLTWPAHYFAGHGLRTSRCFWHWPLKCLVILEYMYTLEYVKQLLCS